MPQILNVQMTVNNLNLNIPPKLFVLFLMSIAQGRTGVMTARRQLGFGVLGSRRVSPSPRKFPGNFLPRSSGNCAALMLPGGTWDRGTRSHVFRF